MKHIARSSLIISVFAVSEKLLGAVRHIIIGRVFGLSTELDVFNAANNIPDLIFALISGGALALAFIPVLSEFLEEKGHTATWDLFSQVTNLVFIVSAILSIFVAIFAKQLVAWEIGIAPGFDAAQQLLVVNLMRLNLIATLLFSLGGLAIAGLQANQHFLWPAIAPTMYDIGALIGVLFLSPETSFQIGPITLPTLQLGIYGLVYGVILGAALFLGVQIPALIHYKFKWTPALNLSDSGVKKVIRLMVPRVLTFFSIQLIFIIQDNLASRLQVGAVTALVYGWLFMQVPETMIGTALGKAILPTLSRQITRGERQEFQRTFSTAIRVILGLIIPSAVLLGIGIRPFVGLLNFDAAGTDLVVWTTRAYLTGMLAHALIEIAARTFYAQQKVLVPLLATILSTITFLIVGVILSPRLGAPGIGLANSLAFSLEAVLLLILLYRSLPQGLQITSTLTRTLVGTGLGGGVSYILLHYLPVGNLSMPLDVLFTISALLAGVAVVAPFVWREVKALLSL
ncbi:MAG: murein biosynthesis integral membrane protein MurJ [Chloroflexota bacterium]|nr:murein biosynthesis integral membrane protein MurJ [Chloroflexota bacterium]